MSEFAGHTSPGSRPASVRGVGEFEVLTRLDRSEARELLKIGMDADVTDARFRDRVLESTTSLTPADLAGLSEGARHRVALRLLRSWGLEAQWRRLYGSERPPAERMRRLLMGSIRVQARARTVAEVGNDLQALGVRSMAPVQRLSDQLVQRAQQPALDQVQRVADLALAPLRQAHRALQAWLQRLFTPVTQAVDNLVRRPLVTSAARLLRSRVNAGVSSGSPLSVLLRTHAERLEAALGIYSPSGASPAGTRDEAERPTVELVLPDESSLTAFFVEERGDRKWRKGPFGWLLKAVPLPLGGSIHDRFMESDETAVSWLAERLLRAELKRALSPALERLACEETTKNVLSTGVELYLKQDWAAADTLLTAGLDGLLMDIAVRRRVLTPGHKLRRHDGSAGGRVSTAGRSDVLTAMGFDPSQVAYLTGLSLGPTGNPPRHGAPSPMGSDVHAAGALLGLILVLSWLEEARTMVAQLLAS